MATLLNVGASRRYASDMLPQPIIPISARFVID
jgi:hypothetical protein